jgi:hypothetical protein
MLHNPNLTPSERKRVPKVKYLVTEGIELIKRLTSLKMSGGGAWFIQEKMEKSFLLMEKRKLNEQETVEKKLKLETIDKLKVGGFGKNKTKKDILKLLNSLELKFKKVKIAPKWQFCFVHFEW